MTGPNKHRETPRATGDVASRTSRRRPDLPAGSVQKSVLTAGACKCDRPTRQQIRETKKKVSTHEPPPIFDADFRTFASFLAGGAT